jgi:hypothetical protein
MAKIEFDFKEFLLQKGEKVGLWTCVGLGVLMLGYSLFMPGKGFLSGSPGSNAKELEDISVQKDNLIASNRPSGELPEQVIDPRLRGTIKPPYTMVASFYALKSPLFTGAAGDDTRRNEPVVLTPAPDSIIAMPILVQLNAYKFTGKDDQLKVGILTPPAVPEAKKKREEQRRKRLSQGGGMPGMPGGMGGMPGGMGGMRGGMGGMGPGGGMGGMGPGGGMGGMPPGMGAMGGARGYGGGMGMGGGPPGMGMMGGGKAMAGSSGSKVISFVKTDELEKHTNAVLAQEIHPTTAVEIVAPFPLREQYKIVERALHLPDSRTVSAELEFDYFDVERRILLSDRKTPAPGANWVAVDVKQQWTWNYVNGVRETERDDPELVPLLIPWSRGLAFPRLVQQETARSSGKGDSKVSRYPKIETELPQIPKALDDLKKAGEQEVPRTNLRDTTGIDPSDLLGGSEGNVPQMKNPPVAPGAGTGKTAPGGKPGPDGSPVGEKGNPGDKGYYGDKLEVPEFSLIRFFDFDIKPGVIYQYRFRVRVKNMNKGRTDVAYPEIADKKVLTSPWVVVPKPVSLPDEIQYFAIDIKNVDWKYNDDKGEERAVSRRARPYPEADGRRGQAAVHIQRWLNTINVSSNPKETVAETVGDWAVAERVLVYRGEYLGHTVKEKVVIWSSPEEDFVLATDPYRRGSEKTIIGVSFAPEAGFEDAILVDFDGGNIDYSRVAVPAKEDEPAKFKAVKDKAPMELLIMTPEGRLVVRDSAEDMENADAKARYIKWLERIKEVEARASKENQGPGKGDPFSGPGGKGGGGS